MKQTSSIRLRVCLLAALPILAFSETLEDQTAKTISGTWKVPTTLYVGEETGGNSMVITNGGRVSSKKHGCLGREDEADNNLVVITGKGSSWESRGVRVGYRGKNNTLKILNGGAFRGDRYYSSIGFFRGGDQNAAFVDGSGSLWQSGFLVVGHYGHSNRLEVTNGGKVDCSSSLYIGRRGDASFNTVLVDGDQSQIKIDRRLCLGCEWDSDIGAEDLGGPGNTLSVQRGGIVSVDNNVYSHCGSTIDIGLKSRVNTTKEYDQSADSTLAFTCSAMADESGQLIAESGLSLGGTLIVRASDNFTPGENYSVQLLRTDGTIQGKFNDVILPVPPAENMWDTSQLYSNGILRLGGPAVTTSDRFTNLTSEQASKYRRFHTTDHRELRAQLIEFYKDASQVELELLDGSRQMLDLSSFVESDQAIILDWHSVYSLLTRKRLRASVKKIKHDEVNYSGELSDWASMFPALEYRQGWKTTDFGSTYNNVSYEVLVENRSGEPLQNVKIEYCIYHQTSVTEKRYTTNYRERDTDARGKFTEQYPPRLLPHATTGSFTIPILHDRRKQANHTSALKIVKSATECRSFHNPTGYNGTRRVRKLRGKLLGIRCRLSIPTASGNLAMIEFADPKTLLETTEWVAPN